jgi:hypothetical protein
MLSEKLKIKKALRNVEKVENDSILVKVDLYVTKSQICLPMEAD